MTNEIFKELLPWLKKHWGDKTTLLLLIAFGLLVGIFTPSIISTSTPELRLLLAISIVTLLTGTWVLSNRIPKNKPGTIGFVISLVAENAEQQIKIRNDFIVEIRKILEKIEHIVPFEVIELPQHHSLRIKDRKTAMDYLRKCNSHFLIYGDVRTRQRKKKSIQSLRMEGMVVHNEIPNEVSAVLASEMSQVIPLKVTIPCEDDLNGFEITTIWFSESVKFVIATAAMLSGDIALARVLLEDIWKSHKTLSKTKKAPGADVLLKLVPRRLSDAYLNSARHAYTLWRESHEPEYIEQVNSFISEYNKLVPKTVHFYTMRAIWLFVTQRNINAALVEINKCKALTVTDPSWRYSLAFLEAYQEKMDHAVQAYNAAFAQANTIELPFEVEEFIAWILVEEPGKYQFHFCLGLLNMRTKDDKLRALSDFQEFVSQDMNNKFPSTVALANQYISSIKEDLKKSPPQ